MATGVRSPAEPALTTTDDIAQMSPLEDADPPRLGAYRLEGRLSVSDAGIIYAGHDGDERVAVVLLNAGAYQDPSARERFVSAVQRLQSTDPEQVLDRDVDGETSPWVALAHDGASVPSTAAGVLSEVLLDHLPPIGRVRGPDFRPYWHERRGPGFWRLWPLPWPERLSPASRLAFLVALAIMLVLAALAILLALWLFEHQPPAPVPLPRDPTTGTQSPTQSPTPTDSPSPSAPTSPSPTPSGTPTGTGTAPPSFA